MTASRIRSTTRDVTSSTSAPSPTSTRSRQPSLHRLTRTRRGTLNHCSASTTTRPPAARRPGARRHPAPVIRLMAPTDDGARFSCSETTIPRIRTPSRRAPIERRRNRRGRASTPRTTARSGRRRRTTSRPGRRRWTTSRPGRCRWTMSRPSRCRWTTSGTTRCRRRSTWHRCTWKWAITTAPVDSRGRACRRGRRSAGSCARDAVKARVSAGVR